MADLTFNLEIDTKAMDKIIKKLPGGIADIVDTFGFAVEGQAKKNIIRNKSVDTGAMLNSGTTSTPRSRKTAAGIPLPKSSGKRYTVIVFFPVDYSAHVEFGTSRARAKPYLGPAVIRMALEFGKPSHYQRLFR